ncbi:hypothetical protein I550_5865 [Mycobacterium intracellulare 1956]|uniref:Uncharacterized protein n=1 Tax=Mycobacterium intracellulare 1956 TaxID=1299331 RepID=X8CDQ1_MYCIT|nr:hypothetical protein I548_2787 [Mycobacterium intracellulare]EUA54224.1 hypothetical protein I550_5865 [Mycobacterium intracellulare 1956]
MAVRNTFAAAIRSSSLSSTRISVAIPPSCRVPRPARAAGRATRQAAIVTG